MVITNLLEYEENTREIVLASYGVSEDDLARDIAALKEWLQKQPHLPHDVTDKKLIGFLLLNKFSLEKAKKKLDMYFTVRTLLPQYFKETVVTNNRIRTALKAAVIVPLPKAFKMRRIFAASILNPNAELFDPVASHGFAFQTLDVLLEEDGVDGAMLIVDAGNFGMGHAFKADFMLLKHVKIIMENVFSGRVHGMHVVNGGHFMEKTIGLMKTIFKAKIMSRVNVHKSLESLHEVIPKEFLPSNFGGDLKSLEELSEDWCKKLEEYEPYLQKLNSHEVDEKMRPKELISDLFEDLQGSFKKLDVD